MKGGMCVCLYVYECALLERWVYVLCYVSCVSFFLPFELDWKQNNPKSNVLFYSWSMVSFKVLCKCVSIEWK